MYQQATSLCVLQALASISDAKLPLDTVAEPQHVAIGSEREGMFVPAKHLDVHVYVDMSRPQRCAHV